MEYGAGHILLCEFQDIRNHMQYKITSAVLAQYHSYMIAPLGRFEDEIQKLTCQPKPKGNFPSRRM